MCCLAEIGMMVFGILTLVRGRFQLSSSRVVVGGPAYTIGILLTATLPVIAGVSAVIGFVAGARAAAQGGRMPEAWQFAIIDWVTVPLVLVIVLVIALSSGKRPEELAAPPSADQGPPPSFPPPDPNNPYASPFSDGGQPPYPPFGQR